MYIIIVNNKNNKRFFKIYYKLLLLEVRIIDNLKVCNYMNILNRYYNILTVYLFMYRRFTHGLGIQ